MTPRRPALAAITLAGVLVASACSTGGGTTGGSASDPMTSSGTSSASASAAPSTSSVPANRVVDRVSITGNQVTPSPGNLDVPLGKTLRLIVTSDHDDQLHAHGFNVEVNLKAGQPTTLDLKATTPGVYEIETHHPPLTLLHVVVR
jgi:heme/copper-type cytochrome/quinol oxidase subunit 2